MTIGLFTDTYPPDINGVATAVKTLYDELTKLGHDVYVITTNLIHQHHLTIDSHIIRVPGIALKKIYSYRITTTYPLKVAKYLDKIKFDVIHVNTESTIGIFARKYSKSRRIPLVYTYHSLYTDFTTTVAKENTKFDKFLKWNIKKLSKKLATSPAEFITPSYKAANVLRTYGIKRYINIVPNGINLSNYEFKPYSKEEINEIKNKYELQDKRILIIVGRLGQEKGIDKVLNCFRYYINNSTDENTRLLIIGTGPYEKKLKEHVKETYLDKYVIFTGKVPHNEIYKYYQMADVLISGSKSETQGLTINEAMASKCLVLAIEDDCFKYEITDRKTGFLYNSPVTFEMKLKQIFNLSSQEKEKILNSAYNNNKELCSPEKYAKDIINIYEKAIRSQW